MKKCKKPLSVLLALVLMLTLLPWAPLPARAEEVTGTVVFDKTRFAITTEYSGPGTISAADHAEVGDTVEITVTPDDGARLRSLIATANGLPVEIENDSFVMPKGDVTVTAVFEQVYEIHVEDTIPGGTVTADKAVAAEGETVTLTVQVADGYDLLDGYLFVLREDNSDLITVTDGSFEMPDSSVYVFAAFVGQPQTLRAGLSGAEYGSFTVSVNGGNAVEVDSDGLTEILGVRTGDSVTVTFVPNEIGRVGSLWLEDPTSHEEHHESDIENNAFTFTMPAEARDIWVRFVISNPTETVAYIDENGVEQTVVATVLTGLEEKEYSSDSSRVILGKDPDFPREQLADPEFLAYIQARYPDFETGETWYVVKEDITYEHNPGFPTKIQLKGYVHLIIADGATLTVQNGFSGGYELSVYGQALGTGRIVSNGSIDTEAVAVCSGGLTVDGDVDCQKLNIFSGETIITNSAWVHDTLTLGCRTEDDSITVGSYWVANDAAVFVRDGQTLTDGVSEYTGTLKEADSNTDVSYLNCTMLTRAHGHVLAELEFIPAVAPTYDPATGEYTMGTKAHYHCGVCGGNFIEVSGNPEPIASIDAPYFTFWKMPSVSGVVFLDSYNGADANVVIPETVPASLDAGLAGLTVTHIENDVFAGHTELTTVTAGSGLVSIGSGAFAGCTSLTDLTVNAAQRVSYDFEDPNGGQDSFDGVPTTLTIHATHASELYQAAVDYGFAFEATDRHDEPDWSWSSDGDWASALFNCNNCPFAENPEYLDDYEPVMTVQDGFVSYTATVTLDGEIYTSVNSFSCWEKLQNDILFGGDVVLQYDCVAGSDDPALLIRSGDVTIDLNGHTIDRGLANGEAKADGYVIQNNGHLWILDSSAAGTGKITGGNTTGNGGAIRNSGQIYFMGGTITGNAAAGNGGAVHNGNEFLMDGGTISDNTAGGNGGAFYVNGGSLQIQDGVICNNSAAGDGGAIYSSGVVSVENAEIYGNHAEKSGGAISAHTGLFNIWSGTIRNNTSGSHGGAIYLGKNSDSNYAQMTLGGGSITGNTAANQGGGICVVGQLTVSFNPVVKDNTAGTGNNIYLRPTEIASKILFDDPLEEGAELGVYTETAPTAGTPLVFTEGLDGYGTADCFFSDRSGFEVTISEGEAALTAIETARVVGHSISLQDEIGVNFYIWLPAAFDNSNTTVTFTWGAVWNGEDFTNTATAEMVSATSYGSNWRVTCSVAAKHMTDEVSMTVVSGDETILEDSFSVVQYAELAKTYFASDTKLMKLLCEMLNYGGKTQIFFDYRASGDGSDLASGHIAAIDPSWEQADTAASITDVTSIPVDQLPDFGLTFRGATLVTESKIAIRLYFRGDATGITAMLGQKALEFQGNGRNKYLEISGINAPNIFDTYTVTLTKDGLDPLTLTYGAAQYYNGVMAMDDGAAVNYNVPNLKAVVAAMYQYYLSAKALLN